MNEDIKKLEEEKAILLQKLQSIEQDKNKILTRLVEVQGVIKYLQEKEQPKKEAK